MFFSRYDNNGEFQFNPDEDYGPAPDELPDDDDDFNVAGTGDGRPKSGKQARQARSARIRSAGRAGSARPRTAVGGVGGEEFVV